MRCPECDNTDYETLNITNDGFGPMVGKCLLCGCQWVGESNIMKKGDTPSKREGDIYVN